MTPLNLILFSLLLLVLYLLMRPRSLPAMPKPPPPTVFKTFTPPTLVEFDGTNGKPIYFAVRGQVFDVSAGRQFYGPGGPYANFAGRDASRGLALGSFDSSMLTEDLNGPLDSLEDLTPDQEEALRGWEERFQDKYLVVGKLVSVKEAGSAKE
jgi:membrane-associated progesterone receptor component